MDIEEFRRAGYQAIDRICDMYYAMQDSKRPVVSQAEPGYLRQALPASPPEKGEDYALIADDYQKLIVPGLTLWQHPSFFAYFPTASTFEAILGDLYATSVPNPGFNWSCSPASTELEAVVMDWSAQMLGLDPAFYNTSGVGGGVLQTTASDSALVAIVAARARYTSLHPSVALEDLVVYTTTQTHSLGAKAALVLGLACRSLPVKAEENFALRGEILKVALKEDHAKGKRPFVLVATVGTTSSGAVDRIDEIGAVVSEVPGMWMHVDAAWAGIALACPEYREFCQLDAINTYADSFCTNFHKWGLVNFDASTLWVRNRKHLTDALDITPEFLRTKHGDAGTVIDYRNWHLALGRRFRSLKVWFVLRGYGVEGFRTYIRRSIGLNETFADLVRGSSVLELVTTPSLALSVIRVSPSISKMSAQELNVLNRVFWSRVSSRPEIYLTQTDLNGVFCVRFAVGSLMTTEEHIKQAFNILTEEAEEALRLYHSTPPA
ncbi:hypothetical protein PUNSTDRAFT_55958 [Punctularia strigosozonata HHB-11173 SS5]|uniref:PLP-dependent transferase n=1 Tax=Punctularia strigosozonata (strain HHB-11173) TaxID=741275 RepID=R7S104_PUNST|nr:uncharacterized protein PUNSTDRAFT_55958 [Punctularia strigosozonata HHB-11173 SS5]EIN03898.1 hypothetical protein PUNSTDRAFT_55958 [Punctularia strigosozonata HHB-11173 SS5]